MALASAAFPAGGSNARFTETYYRLPLRFEPNLGQSNPSVKFLSRGFGGTLFLNSTDAVLQLGKSTVRIRLAGANRASRIEGLEPLPGKSNYFFGSNPGQWQTNVPQYARVRVENAYPGVDVVYYGNQRQLEYDLVIRPGVNPNVIQLDVTGADKLRVDAQGDLVLHTADGEIRQHRPRVYQAAGGVRREIPGRYVLRGKHRVSFQLARYDSSRPLVIDPILSYASYLGGGKIDQGCDIAVDAEGNVYVTGYTTSFNFPTPDPSRARPTSEQGSAVFVAKVNAAGSALIYSTFMGNGAAPVLGGPQTVGAGIAVDSEGSAYVTGWTDDRGFPTTPGAFQTSPGDPNGVDAFVAKLNPTGSALVYSTYLGGKGTDRAQDIAVDLSGNAYVTGYTNSDNFPSTPGAFQPKYSGGTWAYGARTPASDAFVTKLNPTGSALVYSTYLGGGHEDVGKSIVVDAAGDAYIAGSTYSVNFPVAKPFQRAHSGGTCSSMGDPCRDVFVTKLSPSGSELVFSTFLGGAGKDDVAEGIVIDASGSVYVTGWTASSKFPTTPGAFQTTYHSTGPYVSLTDGFVTKLNATGASLVYSTYLGGESSDVGQGIAVDSLGNAYVTGNSGSRDFPLASQFPVRPNPYGPFVTKLNPSGSGLIYSTFLGTGNWDKGSRIALDSAGSAYVTGNMEGQLPAAGVPPQGYGGGGYDAFVAKIAAAGSVSSASFVRAGFAPESVAAAFGEGQATSTQKAETTPLPTSLAGTTVKVIDSEGVERLAPLFFVSPGQVNYLIPAGTASGPARVILTSGDGRSYTDVVQIEPVAPALFSANASGQGVAAAVAIRVGAGGSQTNMPVFQFDEAQRKMVPAPLDLGAESDQFILILFGTGIRHRSDLSAVRVKIDEDDCEVLYAGAQGEFVGLDQVNIRVPRSVIGFGEVDVVLTVDGRAANKVTINLGGVPRPRIKFLKPWGRGPGQSVGDFTITGRFLDGATGIEFIPSAGLTVSNLKATATTLTAQLAVASDAAPGTRLTSVTSAGGASATLPFTIRPRDASPAPVISNLTVNAPMPYGSNAVISGRFDFTDAEADIASTGSLYGSAKIAFSCSVGTKRYTIQSTGPFLHLPGQTSGTVNFAISYSVSEVILGGVSVSFTLTDAAGNQSNSISFQPGLWVN